MTASNPDNGISAAAAKRIWSSIPKQLLRSSTKKFKYSEVVRGGRRTSLLEPLEWLEAAGILLRNDLTCSSAYPLLPFNEDEGSFFKEYICDTGLMFYKFGVEPEIFPDHKMKSLLNSDFRGALAENSVMLKLAFSCKISLLLKCIFVKNSGPHSVELLSRQIINESATCADHKTLLSNTCHYVV